MPITRAEIEAAHARIAPHIRRTPVLTMGSAFGHDGPVSLKLEFLQHAGSFKTRGAFNTLLSKEVPAAGVAAASGGNHGAAVAYAAKQLGVKARIFVPEISSPAKIAVIRSHGAEVVIGGARYADAQAACDLYVEESGALRIHPFGAESTMIGQGTAALEWEQDVPALDTVLVAVGGGGLISGVASWWAGRVKVVGVDRRARGRSMPRSKPGGRSTWTWIRWRPIRLARRTPAIWSIPSAGTRSITWRSSPTRRSAMRSGCSGATTASPPSPAELPHWRRSFQGPITPARASASACSCAEPMSNSPSLPRSPILEGKDAHVSATSDRRLPRVPR